MQYTFYRWHARRPGSDGWKELGWCMTEEDARQWAEKSGHEIEPIGGADDAGHGFSAFGGALG